MFTLTFCDTCGCTLHVAPVEIGFPNSATFRGDIASLEVADPRDEQTREGHFQLRCRQLITQIRSLGFTPFIWIEMINSMGAVGGAKKLLADHQELVATPWLVKRGRPELTMEHEIGKTAWGDLFTDDERAEAAARLARAEGRWS